MPPSRGSFRRDLLRKKLIEPWAAGMEKIPQFAQKRELQDEIYSIRRRAAADVMRATEAFLRSEHDRLTTISGGHMTMVSGMVRRAHQDDPTVSAPIINRANQMITQATDRERTREFRSLEERSRNLNVCRPTNNEVTDPASARQRGQPPTAEPYFRGRGGRGSCRTRGRRPGRPYSRKQGESNDA